MSYIEKYQKVITEMLDRLFREQSGNMRKAAEKLVDVVTNGNLVYIFGCTHAGILAQEAFYRTGGLCVINPILPPGLTCDVVPITLTSKLERADGYGKIVVDENKLKSGDMLIVHSVSGRNSVPVEMAIRAKEIGVYVVGITSVTYSKASKPRSKSGKNLYEVCDLVIDNCGEIGDAAVEIDSFPQKVSPTSTITGAAVINSIAAEAAGIFMERGIMPPVFMSANIDGGDEINKELMDKYKDQIKYI